MYTLEEFDYAKTKILKYVLYKKRTEYEVRIKFSNVFEDGILEDVISYLKEAGYINDLEYIGKTIKSYMVSRPLSIKETKFKLQSKGINRKDVEAYIEEHYDELCQYERQSAEKYLLKRKDNMHKRQVICYLKQKGYREENLENIEGEI